MQDTHNLLAKTPSAAAQKLIYINQADQAHAIE
jgi:hypothetical protein